MKFKIDKAIEKRRKNNDTILMQKYNGSIIYQSYDEEGVLEIVEADGVRSLHFGSQPRQSSLLLSNPNQLYLKYSRTMMSWQLFKDKPDDILLMGLGGGSIPRYLLYHFPECTIKVLENRHSVVKIARSHFGLPLDPRLKILIEDGGRYIRQSKEQLQGRYSLLLIDAFDHEGLAPEVKNESFFDACKMLMKDNGILMINLWGNDKDLFEEMAWLLGRCFDWKILFLPVKGKGNIIGLAFAEGVPKQTMKELFLKAATLEAQYHIEFPVFVKQIRKNNGSVFKRVIKL